MSTPQASSGKERFRFAPGVSLTGAKKGYVLPAIAHRRLIASRMPPQVVVAMASIRPHEPMRLFDAIRVGEQPIERLGEVIAWLRASATALEVGIAGDAAAVTTA